MSIFETVMLLCFGISWPVSIHKSITTKNVSGKSPIFLSIVIAGYASGIVHKLLYSLDWIIILYSFNMVLVSFDLFLYFIYSKNSK